MVQVQNAEATQVNIQLSKGGSLAGRVIDATTAAPIAQALVTLSEGFLLNDGPLPVHIQASTEVTGDFVLHGLPTDHPFAVTASASGYDSRGISRIDIAEQGGAVEPIEIALSPLSDPNAGPKTEITGIGVSIAPEGDEVLVGDLLEGGGASEAGLKTGDRILAIDGEAVTDMDFNLIVQRVRGPEDTTVVLKVRREDGRVQNITVQRKRIRG